MTIKDDLEEIKTLIKAAATPTAATVDLTPVLEKQDKAQSSLDAIQAEFVATPTPPAS